MAPPSADVLMRLEREVSPPDHDSLGAATLDLPLLSSHGRQVDHHLRLAHRTGQRVGLRLYLRPGGRVLPRREERCTLADQHSHLDMQQLHDGGNRPLEARHLALFHGVELPRLIDVLLPRLVARKPDVAHAQLAQSRRVLLAAEGSATHGAEEREGVAGLEAMAGLGVAELQAEAGEIVGERRLRCGGRGGGRCALERGPQLVQLRLRGGDEQQLGAQRLRLERHALERVRSLPQILPPRANGSGAGRGGRLAGEWRGEGRGGRACGGGGRGGGGIRGE
mmetsp:Transcript_46473/g.106568  ORF Transcript_46473/g.106568 Transcript_46473/m.106568 type:complete len:280 (+) Transcript_46473:3700-4539(+)